MHQSGGPDGPGAFSADASGPMWSGMETRPHQEEIGDQSPVDRRSKQPLLYSKDQLLGRSPIYLRRRRDKQQLVAHLAAASFLVALSLWWVIPLHSFAGPVLFTFTQTHGVHQGDLPTLLFLAVAARSLWKVVALRRPRPVPVRVPAR